MQTLIMCISPFDLLLVFTIYVGVPVLGFIGLVTAVIMSVRGKRARTTSLNLDGADAAATQPAHAR